MIKNGQCYEYILRTWYEHYITKSKVFAKVKKCLKIPTNIVDCSYCNSCS